MSYVWNYHRLFLIFAFNPVIIINNLTEAGWKIYRIASKDFLARPKVVFSLFCEYLQEKYPAQIVRYHGQIIDGDKKWTENRERQILESGVNFSKPGWSKELGSLLEISPCSALRWVRKNMPQFYNEQCRTPRADFIKRQYGCS